MRKRIFALLLMGVLLCSSCNQSPQYTEASNHTTETIGTTETNATVNSDQKTTYPPATVPTITTSATKEADTTSTTGTYIPEIPTVYEDTFESFMPFPSGRGYFFGKVTFEREETENVPFVFFRVIGMEEAYTGEFIVYLVQIVDIFGIENYDTEKVYRMAWRGHLEDQLYGRPPLEIGEVYGRFLNLEEEGLQKLNLWQAGLIYDVKEENGKRYLYAYGTDLSIYNCKIPIIDSEENSIYKPGKHDKAIAKLNELGVALPTFDYKVEAEEFYRELN